MNRDCWGTPKEIFAAMNAEFDFKLDAAASEENSMCKFFITEEENCLTTDWIQGASMFGMNGWYAYLNPPYSDIGPFVIRAAEMARKGVGCVMLVMADTSVGWYKEAIKTCQEVRFITGGRLAFISPETGKPVGGNNKGSMFLIWHPFAKGDLVVKHVDRDHLIAAGKNWLEVGFE
jgi:phage N-6-adenine-methyltransferase